MKNKVVFLLALMLPMVVWGGYQKDKDQSSYGAIATTPGVLKVVVTNLTGKNVDIDMSSFFKYLGDGIPGQFDNNGKQITLLPPKQGAKPSDYTRVFFLNTATSIQKGPHSGEFNPVHHIITVREGINDKDYGIGFTFKGDASQNVSGLINVKYMPEDKSGITWNDIAKYLAQKLVDIGFGLLVGDVTHREKLNADDLRARFPYNYAYLSDIKQQGCLNPDNTDTPSSRVFVEPVFDESQHWSHQYDLVDKRNIFVRNLDSLNDASGCTAMTSATAKPNYEDFRYVVQVLVTQISKQQPPTVNVFFMEYPHFISMFEGDSK